jgi:hypothetical protein
MVLHARVKGLGYIPDAMAIIRGLRDLDCEITQLCSIERDTTMDE